MQQELSDVLTPFGGWQLPLTATSNLLALENMALEHLLRVVTRTHLAIGAMYARVLVLMGTCFVWSANVRGSWMQRLLCTTSLTHPSKGTWCKGGLGFSCKGSWPSESEKVERCLWAIARTAGDQPAPLFPFLWLHPPGQIVHPEHSWVGSSDLAAHAVRKPGWQEHGGWFGNTGNKAGKGPKSQLCS